MIEGLKFDVEAAEMESHLTLRLQHHKERASFYQAGGDPVRALRDKQIEHEHRTQLFEFLRGHLVEGETYRLSESDLIQLEFINRVRGW